MRQVFLSPRALTRICCGLVAWVTVALGGFGLVMAAPPGGTVHPAGRENVESEYGVTVSSCYGQVISR